MAHEKYNEKGWQQKNSEQMVLSLMLITFQNDVFDWE